MDYKNLTITFDKTGKDKFKFNTDEIVKDLKESFGAIYYKSTLQEKKEMVYEALLDRLKDHTKFYFKDMEF